MLIGWKWWVRLMQIDDAIPLKSVMWLGEDGRNCV